MIKQSQHLEQILRDRGLGWAIDMFAPSSDAVAHYLKALESLEEFAKSRGQATISFSPDSIANLLSVSPSKADAFLQALVSIRSTPILYAAWRILQGMELDSIDLRHNRLADFLLVVRLRSPHDEGGKVEEYASDDINDIVFVRHLGKSTIDRKPLFDGFYALRHT